MSRGNSNQGNSRERRERLIADLSEEMRMLVKEVVLFNRAVGDHLGMSDTDLQCLHVLMQRGPVVAGQLAEETQLTKGAVTGVIDRLERAGYVWREQDPQDRRRVIVHPLPEKVGREIGPFYESVGRPFAQMCSRYDEDELALILDFVKRSHPLNRKATAMLRDETSKSPNEDRDFSSPLGSVTNGRLVFERGASVVKIWSDASIDALLRARFEDPKPTIRAEGGTVTVRQRRRLLPSLGRSDYVGEIVLNATLPWEIEIRGGMSGVSADLGSLVLKSLDIKGGASGTTLRLPHPSGTVALRVLGGASDLTVQRPEGVGVRVLIRSGANKLAFDGQRFGPVGGETRWQSPDYEETSDCYDIEISGGANNLTVDIG